MNNSYYESDATRIHQQDIDGCNYTMSVIGGVDNRIDDWFHTSSTYEGYDMVWDCHRTNGNKYEAEVENKDRRWKWKQVYDPQTKKKIRVQDFEHPQYLDDYPSQMLEFNKYEKMMESKMESGRGQLYTAAYQDGIWAFDLSRLPRELIYKSEEEGGWKSSKVTDKTTMKADSEKVEKDRILIPNKYGKVIRTND